MMGWSLPPQMFRRFAAFLDNFCATDFMVTPEAGQILVAGFIGRAHRIPPCDAVNRPRILLRPKRRLVGSVPHGIFMLH
jgi:hypothetical protein